MIYSKEEILAGKLFLIDKPLDWTSFDVVNKIRFTLRHHYGFKKLKVGHAGTLDPLATGLLLIAVGRKTKELNTLMGMEKGYEGSLVLGKTTPSFDLETGVDAEYPIDHLNAKKVEAVADQFLGLIEQVPPVFSAIKKDGKRAYESAREGEEVKLEARAVSVHELSLEAENFPEVHFKLLCSKGFYVRSLVRDIGKALDSGAYMSALRRTSIGAYQITDALSMEQFLALFPKKQA